VSEWLSFHLKTEFIDQYRNHAPRWGFPVSDHGDTLGEHAFLARYSRRKDDGTRERFHECLERVISGAYSIQKSHTQRYNLPWNENIAHSSAEEAYKRAWDGKWLPPGRGLWMCGTEFVHAKGDGSALNNCAFLSTENIASMDDPSFPFCRMMDMLMLGIGVGFDSRGAQKLTLHEPSGRFPHAVADSREGWCESLGALLRAFFLGNRLPVFDYSKVRPAGSLIHGFGGSASGPEPLRILHEQITGILSGRGGQPLTSTDIVDLGNLVGKCVVAGNVRRSAEVAFGDADDDQFLDLKDWRINPVRTGPDGWSHLSNNSILACTGGDYSHIASRIALNGEPGLFYLDVARNFGRLADPPDGKDYRAKGGNPCQPAWAALLTPEGIRTMREVEAGDSIWSQDGWVRITHKVMTGVKPVYRYRTTAGYVDATENHRVMSGGIKVELQDAQSVDRLRGGLEGSGHDSKDILAGLLLGDGYVHVTAGNPYHVLIIGTNDQDYFTSEVASLILRRHGSDKHWVTEPVVAHEHLVPLPERRMPAGLLGNPSVLRGLYSANGSVVRSRVTFKTTSPGMRDDIQLSLSALGIASYYTTNQPSRIQWPNGEYESRESYDINIGRARDVRRFAEIIGFIQDYKMRKLEENILSGTGQPDRSFDIREVEFLGEHEVWDITVDGEHHTYWSGGLNVSNCLEQVLEDNEICCLVETFPTNATDLQDYLRTLKFSLIYGKSVTLLPTRWSATNEVVMRNRRIGISMSGVAMFAEQHGWPELRRWQDAAYQEIRRWDRLYSEWLGVRESIRLTTIKPSGTVSLLFGVTPGVHFPRERGWYVRTVREMKDSPFAKALEEAGYPVEPSVSDPGSTVVISFPVEGPDIRPEYEVSVWEKTALAAHCQRYFSDNSVSCTITFSQDEAKEIPAVLRAFDGQLKSISFLPMAEGTYAQAPYQRVDKATWDAMRANLKPIDWDALYDNEALPEAEGESYCANDVCTI
jgi:ribonucleotide reductase alpha subunit